VTVASTRPTDGGETWELVLDISEHTGVNEVHLDPRDPDVAVRLVPTSVAATSGR
jgi:hypothetical protein